jgi:hypothetical protein
VKWSTTVVAPGSGTPTGTVTVDDGDGNSCSGPVGSGATGCSLISTTAGAKTLTATYSGDTNFNGSSGTTGHTVNKANTTTAITSDNNPSTFGSLVTFTATITPAYSGGAAISGTVDFKDGATVICAAAVVTSGTATCATSTLLVGGHSITGVYSGDANYKYSTSPIFTQSVGKYLTTTLVTVTPGSQQYSDKVTFEATVTPDQVNGLTPAASVTFKIGTQVMGSAALSSDGNGNLTATLADVALLEPTPYGTAPTGQLMPGIRTVTAVFYGINPNFTVPNATTSLTITKEDATATYTGAMFAATACTTCNSAVVTLSATIQDITATMPGSDANPGDIRNAKVEFWNRDANTKIATVNVGLVNAGDTKTGTATYNWSVNIGTAQYKTFTVGVVVNNYYTRNSTDDNVVVNVSKPVGNLITGGGYLINQTSSGLYPGEAGKKTNFGFNVKYNKSNTNLQGNINVIIRNGGRVYQIKGNSMTSLVVNPAYCAGATQTSPCYAIYNGKASIQDITNPLAPIAIDGNATLQVTLTDKGEPSVLDSIAITVWNKSGGMWFSSQWDGVKSVEQLIAGGNLVVR